MDEQQLQQQIVQLVQAAMQGDEQATQQIQQIMQAAQQGDQQATQLAQMIQYVAQQMQQQQVQAAKFGAKLNYIKQLRGVCPDGYEMQYFKKGGRFCKQCVAKQKRMEQGGIAPSNPVDAFKCGRKMKKKACGGSVEKDKCGNKMKSAACGSKLPMDKCGGKAKKNDKVKAQKGAKLIAKTGKGEDFMAGSPLEWYSKPAQSLLRQDGSQYMTRVIPQPGDTVYIEPEWVDMKNPKYSAYRNKFDELWNKRNKPSAKPKATK